MSTKRPAQLSKPTLNTDAARKFATAAPAPSKAASREEPIHASIAADETASAAGKVGSGQIPEGDVRLTANIRKDLHLKLKIEAAIRGTTIGEIIEGLIESHLDK
jgi:hypothetical protein